MWVMLAMQGNASLPVHDWQFWVATLCAILAAAWLARRLWKSVSAHRRRTQKRVELTLDRKAVPYASRSRPDDH